MAADNKNAEYKRGFFQRQLVVDASFQREANWLFLGSSFLGMLSFLGGWVFLGHRFFESLSVIIDSVSDEARQQLITAWNQVFVFSIVMSIVFCGLIALIGLIFTNRVAGPIYRIDIDLKKMMESNEFREIKTRKNDFFPEHLKTINLLIQKLISSKKN
jgi:hypothetical protein